MSEELSLSTDFTYSNNQILALQIANRPTVLLSYGVNNILENYNQTILIDDNAVEDNPYIVTLPPNPNTGIMCNILQGKNNNLTIDGNGKTLNLVYLKADTGEVTLIAGNRLTVHNQLLYDGNFVSNYSIIYNGTEWVMLSNVVLCDITAE